MKIVTAAEMSAIDRATSEQSGVPATTLMENAGTAVAEFVASEFPGAGRIVVICGRGNNGGDGFVAARKLHEKGKQVTVILLANTEELKGDAAVMLAKMPMKPEIITQADDEGLAALGDFDLIVDAILGTGVKLPVEGLYAVVIRAINASGAPVVAVDIPSGADADAQTATPGEIVRADAIVTFTAWKPAHIFQFDSIPTVVRQIGSPDEIVKSVANMHRITPEDFAHLLAPRKNDGHKGDYGHVLVLGGSAGKSGAPAMAGMAALRCGAGLVTVACPKSVQATVASFCPEVMTEGLAESEEGVFSILTLESLRRGGILKGKDVLAIGPGISRHKEAAQLVRSLVDKLELPSVLDADGLNAYDEHVQELNMRAGDRIVVLTPHPGEMARLCGKTTAEVQANRVEVARKFAVEHRAFVVLKGQHTLVAEPSGEVWVNTTGNPGMATGGTGDILTGMIAAMLGQHPAEAATAVIAAVYLHGMAGDIAREQLGEMSMTATDLLLGLPQAIREAAESVGNPTA